MSESISNNAGGEETVTDPTVSNKTKRRGRYRNLKLFTFKGKIEDLAVLGARHERKQKDQFMKFQKEIENYVLTNFKNANDIIYAVRDFKDPRIEILKRLPKRTNTVPSPNMTQDEKDEYLETMKLVYTADISNFSKRKEKMESNLCNLFGLIWGQCSPALKAEVMGINGFKEEADDFNCVWLIKELKKICLGLDRHVDNFVGAFDVLKSFYTLKQGRDETLENYYKRFEASVESVKLSYGSLTNHEKLITLTEKDNTIKNPEKATTDHFLAIALLKNADPIRYTNLWRDLENDMLKGNNNYPVTLSGSFNLLCNYKTTSQKKKNDDEEVIVSFYQQKSEVRPKDTKIVAGSNGVTKINSKCYSCNNWGHIRYYCPTAKGKEEVQGTRAQISLSQFSLNQTDDCNMSSLPSVPKHWLILDSGSTISTIMNRDLIKDIYSMDDTIRVFSNGGHQDYSKKGMLTVFPFEAYYNPNSLANILSLSEVSERYRVTMDTDVEPAMVVHLNNNVSHKFTKCGSGLYYIDTSKIVQSNDAYAFLSTVKSNKSYFSRREISGADKARDLQAILGWPSTADLKSYVNRNLITNCPITVDDINRAEAIYGPQVALLKGKTVRKSPEHNFVKRVQLPSPLLEQHSEEQLNVDFLFVNGKPYLHTKSTNIKFVSIQPCRGRGRKEIEKGLEKVLERYHSRGIKITDCNCDNEFEKVRPFLEARNISANIVARNEHVGIVERSIRTVKERVRCIFHSIPYRRMPRIMIDAVLQSTISWLNAFPNNEGISRDYSPASIVLGNEKPDFKHLKLSFGSYVQVYGYTDNTPRQRVEGAIALRSSNNQGGYYFMSLETGKQLHGRQWTELPVTDFVIRRVEELGKEQGSPIMHSGYPIFEWRPGSLVVDANNDDENEDSEYDPHDDEIWDASGDDNSEDDSDDDSVDSENDQESDDDKVASEQQNHSNNNNSPSVQINVDMSNGNVTPDAEELAVTSFLDSKASDKSEDDGEFSADESSLHMDESGHENGNDNNENEDASINLDDDEDFGTEDPDVSHGEEKSLENENEDDLENNVTASRSGDTSERPRRSAAATTRQMYEPSHVGQSYHPKQLFQKSEGYKSVDTKALRNDIVNYLFAQVEQKETGGTGDPQMTARKGIRLYGEAAITAIFNEYKQLKDLEVFGEIKDEDLTPKVKRNALRVINLIKRKRCGKIKGRTVADGRPQRAYVRKEDTTSPTVSTEALMTTLLIDAYEGRKVAIFDVPGAYLQANMPKDKFIVIKIEDEFVDIMCKVNPQYKKLVRNERGKEVLYLRVLKALYGCIESAFLWYETYTTVLKEMGFVLNAYDKCVANANIDGSQCTIVFYVDDNKISHKNEKVLTKVINKLEGHFGKLEISRGREHNFLGMRIKFIGNEVHISMKDYIREAIDIFPEPTNMKVTSPAKKNLLEINNKAEKLTKINSELYHSIVAKLLWVMKRGRPDIETAIAFLCTRVKDPDVDDWEKLKRLLCFLSETINDVRVIGASSMEILHTWIDASFAVHDDMKGHTGGTMSFGKGVLHAKSSKQKLNTKSSTETELVGVSEYIPYTIWMKNFLHEQGYKVTGNVYQDNQSAIKMEINGRNSCTGNSRHVNIRFFFVKDLVDKKEIEIVYCPTETMLADFFTKPLQGKLFHLHRAVIMGWNSIESLKPKIVLEERVERIDFEPPKLAERTYASVVKNGMQDRKHP